MQSNLRSLGFVPTAPLESFLLIIFPTPTRAGATSTTKPRKVNKKFSSARYLLIDVVTPIFHLTRSLLAERKRTEFFDPNGCDCEVMSHKVNKRLSSEGFRSFHLLLLFTQPCHLSRFEQPFVLS